MAAGILQHAARLVVHGDEQFGEAGIDRFGIGRPPRILVGDERGIGAVEGGGKQIYAGHGCLPSDDQAGFASANLYMVT